MNLAADKSQEFGKKVDEFISEVKGQCNDPHQKMLAQVHVHVLYVIPYTCKMCVQSVATLHENKFGGLNPKGTPHSACTCTCITACTVGLIKIYFYTTKVIRLGYIFVQ